MSFVSSPYIGAHLSRLSFPCLQGANFILHASAPEPKSRRRVYKPAPSSEAASGGGSSDSEEDVSVRTTVALWVSEAEAENLLALCFFSRPLTVVRKKDGATACTTITARRGS